MSWLLLLLADVLGAAISLYFLAFGEAGQKVVGVVTFLLLVAANLLLVRAERERRQ